MNSHSVDQLSLPDDDKAAAILYKHNSYNVVNQSLDQIALRIANMLQHAG
jgi:hypothetical protein